MPLGYWISVTLHVLAALLWLGGMFFLGAVGAPALRQVEPASLRQALFHAIGLKARTVGWVSIGILLITGPINLAYKDLWRWDGVFGSSEFWATSMGTSLAIKLACVVTMVVLSAVHDFWLGPRAGLLTAGSVEATRARVQASYLARITALAGIVLVLAAVRLARGG